MLGKPFSISLKYVDNNQVNIIRGEITVDDKGYFKGVFIKGTTSLTIHNVHGIFIDMYDKIAITALEYPTKKDGKNRGFLVNKLIPEYCINPKIEGLYDGGRCNDILIQNIQSRNILRAEEFSLDTLIDIVIGFRSEGIFAELDLQKSYFN